jgi:hypothetical protein
MWSMTADNVFCLIFEVPRLAAARTALAHLVRREATVEDGWDLAFPLP